MKALPILTIVILFCNFSYSQQWIDQNYQTNPPIEIEYGQAVNFNGSTKNLKLDLYVPVCDTSTTDAKSPLMIVIHGGSFISGSKSEQTIVALCKSFAARGYVTASIEYRLGIVNSKNLHTCAFPNYQCFFATDEAEWYRAWFRAVQDAKGAVRYLINRHEAYNIDSQNVFVVGESAGALIAMGVGFLDVPSEKLQIANSMDGVPRPNSNTYDCPHNVGETFATVIDRPDLGTIEGTIELSGADYTIRGVGNMYGAMFQDLLAQHNPNKPKPALYSFHRPCDLIVPADSKKIFYGLNWCFTNGYQCYAISNTPVVHGSRTIEKWNTDNNYNYTILSEFTNVEFPNSYIGEGSCLDQLPPPFNNNQCHGYDNFNLRQQNMAIFFAPLITTNVICDPILGTEANETNEFKVFPIPATNQITIQSKRPVDYQLIEMSGRILFKGKLQSEIVIDMSTLSSGTYFLQLKSVLGNKSIRILKE